MGWSAVLYSPYNSTTESIFAINGTYRKRVDDDEVFEWGMDAPDTRPTIAAGSSTGLTGTYNVKFTWCRKEKATLIYESNPSESAASALALSNEDLKITHPTPEDSQINWIRFYRTADSGSTYSLDTELPYANRDYSVCYDWEEDDGYISGYAFRFTVTDSFRDSEDTFSWEPYHDQYTGTATAYWKITGKGDNLSYVKTTTADGSLGTEAATNHNRPPLGSFVAGPSFNGTLFIIKNHQLYFSLPKQPEYWPSSYYIDVSSVQFSGKCLVFYDKQPYFLTLNQIYYIAGTSASAWVPQNVGAKTGAQSQNGAVAIEGYGIFHIGSDGLYLFTPSGESRAGNDIKISRPLDPIFNGETRYGVKAAGSLTNAWLAVWETKLYFGYPGANDTYPKNIIIFHLEEKRLGYYTRGEEIHHIAVDYTNNRLMAVDGDGYVWEIEDRSITTDEGEQISWDVESKEFTLQTRKHFPRWVKYDVDASDENCTATGTLLLDGVSHQTHSLTENRKTRRRLVTTGNGNRCSLRVSGSGPVSIHMLESQ